ncbi:MAG TPA: DUF3576 domain-containing protein [Nitrospinota bacterium]|nr:DUF3576 domain-containing protein [Nitrospinota bacterium]
MTFEGSWDDVFEALLLTVKEYPVVLIDKEKGVIDTDWYVFFKEKRRIKLNIKLKTVDEGIKIDISSHLEAQKSFLSKKWTPIKSDGKTENSILKEVRDRLELKVKENKE